jgi:hypothetical protein
MDKVADYRIRVKGEVDPGWFDRLGDMSVRIEKEGDETTTVLEGRLRDQAALSGVLNTLYELHHSVISVERLRDYEN